MANPLHIQQMCAVLCAAWCMWCVLKTFRSIQFFRAVINLVKFYIAVGCWCCVLIFVFNFSVWHVCCCRCCHCSIWKFCIVCVCFFSLLSHTHICLVSRFVIQYGNMVSSQNSRTAFISSLLFAPRAAATTFCCIRIRLAQRLKCDFQCASLFPCVCVFKPLIVRILFRKQLASYVFVKFKLTWHYTSIEKRCVISDVLQTANRIELFELQIHFWTVCVCVYTRLGMCEKNGHRVKSMNFKTGFIAARSFSLLKFYHVEFEVWGYNREKTFPSSLINIFHIIGVHVLWNRKSLFQ